VTRRHGTTPTYQLVRLECVGVSGKDDALGRLAVDDVHQRGDLGEVAVVLPRQRTEAEMAEWV
jgi:hypothetical protein